VIPQTQALQPIDGWQSQLRNVVTSAGRLLELLDLKAEDVGFSDQACRDFALKVPVAFVQRMQTGDPRDPLLLQVLASQEELVSAAGFGRDPVGETGGANPHKGIIHKYHGRVLLVVSSGCAINCRYCFRRHFPYADNQNSRQQWRDALGYIAADSHISEVILSGGDPLLASDSYLQELVAQIAAIPHVRRLRIHSRLPVVIPDRVTPQLMDAICQGSLQIVMVIHSNHANELDSAVGEAMAAMADRDITLLNQSVLLAGINDTTRGLAELSERLFAVGVLPYYLHLLDKVQGAAHFDVPENRARELMRDVSARLPGYLVPKLVREVAGARSKLGVPAAASD
jgi:L-lysine 2,3-aminomutase